MRKDKKHKRSSKRKIDEGKTPLNSPWLSKDRKWTLFFWVGMSLVFNIPGILYLHLDDPAFDTLWKIVALLFTPVTLVIFNRTSFVKKDTFNNSEGIRITKKQMPDLWPVALICGGGVYTVLAIYVPHVENRWISSFISFSSLFFGISLYFFIKNCPISIMFNRKFWRFEPMPYRGSEYQSSSSSSSPSNSDMYTSPSYSSLSCNIHNDRR